MNRQLIDRLSSNGQFIPSILLNEYGTVAQESVDAIYDSETRKVNEGVSFMKDNFQRWNRDKSSPINNRALVTLALNDNEEELKHKQRVEHSHNYAGMKERLRRLYDLQ